MTPANPTTSTTGSESCNAMTRVGAGDTSNVRLESNGSCDLQSLKTRATAAISVVRPFLARAQLNTMAAGCQGVKVCTFVPAERTEKETGVVRRFRMPRQTTVFHLSQTNDINQ